MLQNLRYGLRIMSKRNITTILLSASVFSFACNTALPPRPTEGSASTKQAGREPRPIPMPDEQDVASALNVEIEKLDGDKFRRSAAYCGRRNAAGILAGQLNDTANLDPLPFQRGREDQPQRRRLECDRAPATGRVVRPGANRDGFDRRSARSRLPGKQPEQGHRPDSERRRPGGKSRGVRTTVFAPAVRRRIGLADRMRERGESDASPRSRTRARVRVARRAGRESWPAPASTSDREHVARVFRRRRSRRQGCTG
jgi:hypothetical protein